MSFPVTIAKTRNAPQLKQLSRKDCEVDIITINSSEHVTVVKIVGEVDIRTAPVVGEWVMPLIQQQSYVLLDMVNVSYVSSTGLRMLLLLCQQASSKNGKLLLMGLSEEIRDTMSIVGFLDFFITCETMNAGLRICQAI